MKFRDDCEFNLNFEIKEAERKYQKTGNEFYLGIKKAFELLRDGRSIIASIKSIKSLKIKDGMLFAHQLIEYEDK